MLKISGNIRTLKLYCRLLRNLDKQRKKQRFWLKNKEILKRDKSCLPLRKKPQN